MTSRAKLDSLVMLCESEGRIVARHLGNCPLGPEKDDLERYLDVTKAQLFFAKGVIMVEGISESLLLPVFAQRLGRNLDDNAVEVVNVGGTSFLPFARLFNSENPEERLGIPSAILTDDDRCTSRTDEYRLTEEDLHVNFVDKNWKDVTELVSRLERILQKMEYGKESDRAKRAKGLEGGSLITRTTCKTLEYELARIPRNIEAMLEALESIHPKTANELKSLFKNESLETKHKAVCLMLAVRDTKARFAQRLAALLHKTDETGKFKQSFTVPKNIVEILEHVAPFKTLVED